MNRRPPFALTVRDKASSGVAELYERDGAFCVTAWNAGKRWTALTRQFATETERCAFVRRWFTAARMSDATMRPRRLAVRKNEEKADA